MEHWSSFIYLYGVGGVLFFFAIFLGLKKNVIRLNNQTDRRLLMSLLGAYLLYAGFHLVWNIFAIGGPL